MGVDQMDEIFMLEHTILTPSYTTTGDDLVAGPRKLEKGVSSSSSSPPLSSPSLRPISRLKFEQRIRALERSNTELEHFACDASHDLREPLRVISHLAERLAVRKGECLGDEGHQLLSGIVGELDRMQTLVGELLSIPE